MSLNYSTTLEEIKTLIYNGYYNKALDKINGTLEELTTNNKMIFQFLILKNKILIRQGNFNDCLTILDKILQDKKLELELTVRIDFLLQKATLLGQLAQFDEENKIIAEIESLIAKCEQTPEYLDIWLGVLHQLKSWISINKTNFDEAFNHIQSSLVIFNQRNDKENLAKSFELLGTLHMRRGELEKTLDCYQKNLKLREETKNKYEIALALRIIGVCYSLIRNIPEALSYYDRSIRTIEESGNYQEIGITYNGYGLAHFYMGNLNEALKFYQKALFYLEQVGNKQQVAYILSNIGDINKLQGNLEKALEAYSHCLEIFDEINGIQNIGAKLIDIGNIYLQKGEYKKSLTFLKKGLEYRRKTGSPIFIAGSLYMLIKYFSFINNKMEAEKYLKELIEIHEKEKNALINLRAKIAEALVLKMDNRSKSRVKAEEILTKIIDMDIIDIDSYYDAIINLCEILVSELKMSGNQEVLKELNKLIEKLEKIAQKQNSYWLEAEVYWIKAHLALLSWDINGAQKLLANAQIIADEKGFIHLAKKISHEFDRTLHQRDLWEQLRDKNATIIERLELTDLDDLLDKLKQQIIDLEELPTEQPVMLLLIKQTGQPLFKKNFLPEKIRTDESLLSGFIATINAFFNEVFDASGSIERIKHHDLTILIKPIESLLFCYIFKGQSYSAIRKLEEFIQTLQLHKKDLWYALSNPMETTGVIDEESVLVLEEIISEVF